MRSKISSKLTFASCVLDTPIARIMVCVLIEDIGRRPPLKLTCTTVNSVMVIKLCTETIKPVLERKQK